MKIRVFADLVSYKIFVCSWLKFFRWALEVSRLNNLIFTSGQIPLDLRGNLVKDDFKSECVQVIKNIESFTSGLDTFVQSYQNIISVEDKRNISTTLANLKDISTDLNDGLNIEIVKLGTILDNIKSFTDETDELISTIKEFKNTSQSFKNATDKLDNILYKIESGDGTVGKLVNDDILHDNINNLVDELSMLVQDIKDNPIKYMKAYWRGKK